ncbi:MAG TPA: histidinol phosphate phosphatase domain-containing protein [Phycisphaerae bacterium]|nr:histidinol phosphate phosphatase domain-containing protein [Phycisphaerae bacterium]
MPWKRRPEGKRTAVVVGPTQRKDRRAFGMIDLHTHTLLSDGELIPTELARRFEVLGYRAIAFTDHVDTALVETIVPVLVQVARDLADAMEMTVLPGAEVTHCRPRHIGRVVARARELGARIVVVHGETPSEPVIPGTNRAAIEAGCDILAHPGLLTEADAHLAAERGVLLEISGRAGHSPTNGHVARTARQAGAQVIFGSDTHAVADLRPPADARKVLANAGLIEEEIGAAFSAAEALVVRALEREESR